MKTSVEKGLASHSSINMLRTNNLQKNDFDDMDPWSRLLTSTVAWAISSTDHTISQATPSELVFDRDMLFNLKFIAQWH